jgi:deoxycytidine triphosphate deaminase
MKIRLLKDHLVGKKGEVIEVSINRASYLFRMGVGIYHDKSAAILEIVEEEEKKEKQELEPKEKFEFIFEPEKVVHTGLPTDKVKRVRKKKSD